MKKLKLIIQILISVFLVSCSTTNIEVKKFISETKKMRKSSIQPLPHLTEYEQVVYSAVNLRDPFTLPRPKNAVVAVNKPTLVEAVKTQQRRPDYERPREFLENVSLDSLIMVGTIQKRGEMWGLVVDRTGIIHRVKEGNYLGENSGKIIKITEDSIYIDETISDDQGGWMDRKANLSINSKQ